MTHRALMLAVASCFAVASCSDKAAEPPKPKTTPAAAAAPKPPDAPAAVPAPVQVAQASTTKKTPRVKGCNDKKDNCKVTVRVTGTPPNCVITVTPMDLPVAKSAKNIDVKWDIDGDFVFTSTGIAFKSGPFTGGTGGGTKKWKVKDANNDDEIHKYDVEVQKRNGPKCPKLDPTVMNGAEDDPDPGPATPPPDPAGRPAPTTPPPPPPPQPGASPNPSQNKPGDKK